MKHDLSWISTLDSDNLLAVYDVSLDIESELNICAEPPTIPLFQAAVKFKSLLPIDSVGSRDRYCELRAKAISFLEKKGCIKGIEPIEGSHRWQTRLQISLDEAFFRELMKQLHAEYGRRFTSIPEGATNAFSGSGLERIEMLLNKFHAVALELRHRHDNRVPFEIADEYDAQDLVRACLKIFFEDVRPEEWTPSYAGRSTKMDFFLKSEQISVELKKTRSGLTEAQIGDQLIVDIEHYKQRADCKVLVCFVYDPDHRLRNPSGLENDLSRSEGDFLIRVIVRPRR